MALSHSSQSAAPDLSSVCLLWDRVRSGLFSGVRLVRPLTPSLNEAIGILAVAFGRNNCIGTRPRR